MPEPTVHIDDDDEPERPRLLGPDGDPLTTRPPVGFALPTPPDPA